MLREMQEEIARLKAAIEAQKSGAPMPAAASGGSKKAKASPNKATTAGSKLPAEKKIVYKEVIEERVVEGATDEEIARIAEAMDEEKKTLQEEKNAQEEEMKKRQAEAQESEAAVAAADEEAKQMQEQLQLLQEKIMTNEGLFMYIHDDDMYII